MKAATSLNAYYASINSRLTGHAVNGYSRLPSFHSSDVKEMAAVVDEVFEYNLAFLQATFPDMSYESLSHHYVANNCDIDATADMLSHLPLEQQHYNTGDSSEKLPDTLDIGDVPEERGSSSEFPFKKMKDIHIEAGVSSSSGVSG